MPGMVAGESPAGGGDLDGDFPFAGEDTGDFPLSDMMMGSAEAEVSLVLESRQ